MKVKCKKTLYWHHKPGYSGNLDEAGVKVGSIGKKVFSSGNEYEMLAILNPECGLCYVDIYMVGDNGKAYKILHDELHFGVARFAFEHFDFTNIIDENDKILKS